MFCVLSGLLSTYQTLCPYYIYCLVIYLLKINEEEHLARSRVKILCKH